MQSCGVLAIISKNLAIDMDCMISLVECGNCRKKWNEMLGFNPRFSPEVKPDRAHKTTFKINGWNMLPSWTRPHLNSRTSEWQPEHYVGSRAPKSLKIPEWRCPWNLPCMLELVDVLSAIKILVYRLLTRPTSTASTKINENFMHKKCDVWHVPVARFFVFNWDMSVWGSKDPEQ